MLTRLRTKYSLNSGSLSEMASKAMGFVTSPVVKMMNPEVLMNSWPGSKTVLWSDSSQETVTLPKCPRLLKTLKTRRRR